DGDLAAVALADLQFSPARVGDVVVLGRADRATPGEGQEVAAQGAMPDADLDLPADQRRVGAAQGLVVQDARPGAPAHLLHRSALAADGQREALALVDEL